MVAILPCGRHVRYDAIECQKKGGDSVPKGCGNINAERGGGTARPWCAESGDLLSFMERHARPATIQEGE